MKTYIPEIGSHINTSAEKAIVMAMDYGEDVKFTFNDVDITVNSKTTISDAVAFYHSELDRLAKEYRESDEGKNAAKKRNQEVVTKQCRITMMESNFPSTLEGWMKWLKEYTPLADDIEVKTRVLSLTHALNNQGYEADYGVGDDPKSFDTKERMGRYIIGQVLSCLKIGMPPHPITVSFCEKYEALN